MRRLSLRTAAVPLALLGLVIAAYGVFIPLLGLYGDDWPYLWVNHVLGPKGYIDFVSWDRPFSAWIYLLATPILGQTVWAYHLFLALLRWLDAVLFWWVVRQAWPRAGQAAAIAALLFVIYPGFRQQPVPLEFMLHFAVLALFLLSLGLMLRAARGAKHFWTLTTLALVCEAGMFSLEYFFGLELIRPLLLWIMLPECGETRRQRFLRVLKLWVPYLAVLLGFLAWRVLIFKFPSYNPTFLNAFAESPLAALLSLGKRIVLDAKTVTFDAWRATLSIPSGGRTLLLWALVFLAAAVVAGLGVWYVGRTDTQESPNGKRARWQRPLALVGLGLLAILLAGWPFWITGLPVEVVFPWDRSTLAFLPGATLLVAGMIDLVHRRFRAIPVALLVGLAVGLHAQNALAYRTESQELRDFFWQLAWRAPGLKPGTIILSEKIPLYYYSDNSLTPPLNWTYDPAQPGEKQTYNFFDVDERLGRTLPALKEDLPVKRSYRSFRFTGNSSSILMVYARPGSCLRVLSVEDRDLPGLPPKLSGALALSHLDQIVTDAEPPAAPPSQIGPEPDHGWCYYFEQAALARQRGDWAKAASLGDQAQQANLAPHDLSEWLPFIEAYTRTGSSSQARSLSEQVYDQPNLRPALCRIQKASGMPCKK